MRLLSLAAVLFFLSAPVFAQETLPFAKGEKIVYSIKKFGLGGKGTLTFQGEDNVEGRDVYLIVFKAEGFKFFDEEKIYVDRKKFTPVLVVRDVDIGFLNKNEKITEHYADGKIRIVKVADGKTTEQTIEKPGQVDNIYGAIYRYRSQGSFRMGDAMDLRLPTIDIKMKISKMDKVPSGGKKYNAFFMESIPSQYMVWFDTSPSRIPLRITGTAGLGKTNMVITEYTPGTP